MASSAASSTATSAASSPASVPKQVRAAVSASAVDGGRRKRISEPRNTDGKLVSAGVSESTRNEPALLEVAEPNVDGSTPSNAAGAATTPSSIRKGDDAKQTMAESPALLVTRSASAVDGKRRTQTLVPRNLDGALGAAGATESERNQTAVNAVAKSKVDGATPANAAGTAAAPASVRKEADADQRQVELRALLGLVRGKLAKGEGLTQILNPCALGDVLAPADVSKLLYHHSAPLLAEVKRGLENVFASPTNSILWVMGDESRTPILDPSEAVFERAVARELLSRVLRCKSKSKGETLVLSKANGDGSTTRRGSSRDFIWPTHKAEKNKEYIETDVLLLDSRYTSRSVAFELKRVTASPMHCSDGNDIIFADITGSDNAYNICHLTLNDYVSYVFFNQVAPWLIVCAQERRRQTPTLQTWSADADASYIGVAIKQRDLDFCNASVYWSKRFTINDVVSVLRDAGLMPDRAGIPSENDIARATWHAVLANFEKPEAQSALHRQLDSECSKLLQKATWTMVGARTSRRGSFQRLLDALK